MVSELRMIWKQTVVGAPVGAGIGVVTWWSPMTTSLIARRQRVWPAKSISPRLLPRRQRRRAPPLRATTSATRRIRCVSKSSVTRRASMMYCQTEVLGMQSMRRRRHAHVHDLKSRYVENISLFHAYARKNNIWILDHECAHVVVVASTAFQVATARYLARPRSDNTEKPARRRCRSRCRCADADALSLGAGRRLAAVVTQWGTPAPRHPLLLALSSSPGAAPSAQAAGGALFHGRRACHRGLRRGGPGRSAAYALTHYRYGRVAVKAGGSGGGPEHAAPRPPG